MTVALITGITGQDGAYLARLLLQKKYKVFGGYRRSASYNLSRLETLGIREDVELVPLELFETGNIIRVIEKLRPREIYNLAAQSFVTVSFEQPELTGDITGMAALRILEAVRTACPGARFYQASSSEMFGFARTSPQSEQTVFYPRSPYAVAKVFAHYTTRNYREAHGLFACAGILFNHESPLRGEEFVTRKVTRAVARIKAGKQKLLHLGNLKAERDWGYAPEYVEAMWRMMQHSKPDEFVIATGETHSVGEFVEAAFRHAGLNAKDHVRVSPELRRPTEVNRLIGDASKARRVLGWKPKVRFAELVRIMVQADLRAEGL